jgi:hypothetical protein
VIATLSLGSRLSAVRRQGLQLVLAMTPTVEDVQPRVGSDALTLLRALFARFDNETAITVHWLHPWRDRLGRVATRPAWRCSFDRETWSRVVWRNLELQEQVDLLDWYTHAYEGWKLWRVAPPAAAPQAVPADEQAPEKGNAAGEAEVKLPRAEPPVVSAWIEHAGVRLPKPAVYEHGVTIADGAIGYKSRGLMTSAMPLDVVRLPQSWRDDAKTPVTATVSFSSEYLSAASGATCWLRISIRLSRAGRLEAAADELSGSRLLFVVQDKVVDGVHLNKPFTVNGFKSSEAQARAEFRLDRAHALVAGASLTFRWEHGKGAELRLGREGVAALADLLSRLPR